MLFGVLEQLNALTDTLRIVSNVPTTIQPGQRVELQVLSGAPDLFVTEPILDVATELLKLVTQIPVEIQVRWSVKGWSEIEEKMIDLVPGVDFVATDGIEGPSSAFFFKPLFYELGAAPVLMPTPLEITAEVTLHAWLTYKKDENLPIQEVVSEKVVLPLSLGLLPLEIPTLLALFRFDNYRSLGKNDLEPGFVLMVVPDNSYLQDLTEVMNGLLARLDEVMGPLRALAGIAAFLTGLTILRHAVSAQPMLRIRSGDIPNLSDIHMRVEKRFGIDRLNPDLRPHDRVSSLILLAAPGRIVGCYNNEKFKQDEGAFTVETGDEMIALVRNLAISSEELHAHPNVVVLKPNNDDNAFDDSMSSVKFLGWAPTPPPPPLP